MRGTEWTHSIGAFIVRHWISLTTCAAIVAYTVVPALLGNRSPLWVLGALIAGALLGTASGALLERTLKTAIANPLDKRALIAYAPLGCALVTLFFAHLSARHMVESGSLAGFYGAAAPLLGVLMIPIMIETRQIFPHDPWLRTFRSLWLTFIVIGIGYALLGLTPDQSRASQASQYSVVWASLACAVAAVLIVLSREPPLRQASDLEQQDVRSSEHAKTSPSPARPTRTPARSTRA
jgi:hypothetical protein